MIAICGTAMASLAGMLQQRGFKVSGSDRQIYPPMSTLLDSLGIRTFPDFDANRLTPGPDLVIIGNAVSRGNPEVEEVLDRRIPYMSLPEVVREFFIRGKRSIVVAGTHGKTTTTALTSYLFHASGLDPSFLIGGMPANFEQPFRLGAGEFFIIEGDEYDSAFFSKVAKFFYYLPEILVLNNLEYDHADIYPDLEAIRLAFAQLINTVPQSGLVLAGSDDNNVSELVRKSHAPVESFGLEAGVFWRATQIESDHSTTRFTVQRQAESLGRMELPLAGEYNVRNALASIACGFHAGLDLEQVRSALAKFEGVKRRQEFVAEIQGIKIIDDFAHHPTAVEQALLGMRSAYGDSRIWAVFEPASATNARSTFERDYVRALSHADQVIIAKVPRPERAREDEPFSGERVARALTSRGTSARYVPEVPDILGHLALNLESGDLVVIMSNGGFDQIQNRLRQRLEEKFGMQVACPN